MIQFFCVVRFLYFKIFILFNFNSIITMSQDSTSILTDIDIQIEATSAINKMYNFEFDDAEKEFKWLVQEYKNHPLPVFLSLIHILRCRRYSLCRYQRSPYH